MNKIRVINERGFVQTFMDNGPIGNTVGRANQIYDRNEAEGRRVTVQVLVNGRLHELISRARRRRMAESGR